MQFAPPAWDAVFENPPEFPWWLAMNSNGQQMLSHLGLESIQVRSDHTPWSRLQPPLAQLGGIELAASKAIKLALRGIGRRQDRPAEDPGATDVLALLPQRGWEGQGNARNGFNNEYLGPVLRALDAADYRVATTSHLLEGGMGPARALRTAARRGAIQGPPHVWLESYWDRACEQSVRETFRYFRDLFAPGTDPAELGFDAPGDAGVQMMAWLRSQSLRLGLYAGWAPAFARVLEETRPAAVLTTMESFPHHRVMLATAQARGIPTLSLQHGWIGPKHAGYMFAPSLDDLPLRARNAIGVVQPDRLAVYGPAVKELLIRAGPWQDEQIIPVGAPRYDDWAHLEESAAANRRVYNLEGKQLILWPTQTHGLSADENDRNVAAWSDLLTRRDDIRLAIKLHPMEPQDANLYAPLTKLGAILLRREEPLAPWLAAADIVVTKNSTCGIEAAALGKPVLVLNLLDAPLGTDFVTAGIATHANRAPLDSAIAATEKLTSKARLRYAAQNIGKLDGHASQRVLEALRPWLSHASSAGIDSPPRLP